MRVVIMLQIISWNHGKDSIKFLNKEQRLSIEGDSL
jgi:hypothetical protein